MITATGLTKSYGDTVALNGVDFTANRGQVTAVVGPNGSGKSSLLRIISGAAKQDSGDVLVDGRPIQEFSPLGNTLGFYIDGIGVHPTWQVKEQLSIMAPFSAMSDKHLRDINKNFGLAPFEHLRGRELSVGMRGRTGIALGLHAEPEHVILDEPANGLDPQSLQWLRQLIRDKAQSGGAVIFSSHLMAEVEDVADRIVVLFRGRVLWDSSLDELVRARSRLTVYVEGNNLPALEIALERHGMKCDRVEDTLRVYDIERAEVGFLAHNCGCVVTGLREERQSLEQIYIEMLEEAANDNNSATNKNGYRTQLSQSEYAHQPEPDFAITSGTQPEPVSHPNLRGFTQQIRSNLLSEFRRVRASRPLLWVLAGLAVFSFAMPFLVRHSIAQLSHDETTALLSTIYTGASTIPYLSAFIGVYSVTTELGSGFGRYLYGVWGNRGFAVTGKFLTATILASVFALTSIIFGATGTIAADGWRLWSVAYWLPVALHAASTTVASCAFGLMGASIGFLIRRFRYGLLVFLILFIIAPILTAQLLRISAKLLTIVQLLPLAAGNTFVDPISKISFLSATALFAWAFGLVAASFNAIQHADL